MQHHQIDSVFECKQPLGRPTHSQAGGHWLLQGHFPAYQHSWQEGIMDEAGASC